MNEHADQAHWPRAPYPGLRPFNVSPQSDESLIFFGRRDHTFELIDRLAQGQFLAVLGPSGCGKSSLVKVGLIPELAKGYVHRAGAQWIPVAMEPGRDPLTALAESLAETLHMQHLVEERVDAASPVDDGADAYLEEMRDLLSHPTGLVDFAEEYGSRFGAHANLLILVDQFEELFHEEMGDPELTTRFINLLLNVFNSKPAGMYVVITMRTDYLEQCARYNGLPEALNAGQFLTPRLNGGQLRKAIENPVKLAKYGGDIEDALVDTLLTEMTDSTFYDPDLLPLMQHALLQLWNRAVERARATGGDILLTMDDYTALSGGDSEDASARLGRILSLHADDVHSDVEATHSGISEIMFRLLSRLDDRQRKRRRVATIEDVAEVAGCDAKDVETVVQSFADTDVNFIRWNPHERRLYIMHESLIRNWDKLEAWAKDEKRLGDEYETLVKLAIDEHDQNILLKARQLEEANVLLARNINWDAWTPRYGGHLKQVRDYIRASEQELAAEEKRVAQLARYKTLVPLVSIALLMFAFVAWNTYESWHDAERSAQEAKRAHSRLLAAEALRETRGGNAANGILVALSLFSKHEEESSGSAIPNFIRDTLESLFPDEDSQDSQTVVPDAVRALYESLFRLRERLVVSAVSERVDARSGSFVAGAFFRDSSRFLTVKTGTVLQFHSTRSDPTEEALPADLRVKGFVYLSPSADHFVSVDRNSVQIWETLTQSSRPVEKAEGRVTRAIFSPNGTRFALIYSDGTFDIFDTRTAKQIERPKGEFEGVTHLAIDDSGTNIVAVFRKRQAFAEVRDYASGDLRATLSVGSESELINHISTNASGTTVAVSTGREPTNVKLFYIAPRQPETNQKHSSEAAQLEAELGIKDVFGIALSPIGGKFAASLADHSIGIWDVRSGRQIERLGGHSATVEVIRFSPDASRLMSLSADGSARVWDLSHDSVRGARSFLPEHFNNAVFSEDLSRAVLTIDDQARVVDMVASSSDLVLEDLAGKLKQTRFSPDGTRVATVAQRPDKKLVLQIWNSETGKLVADAQGQIAPTRTPVFNAAGSLVAAPLADKTMGLWDAATGEIVRKLPFESAPLHFGFSGDGRFMSIVTINPPEVHVWPVAGETPSGKIRMATDQSASNSIISAHLNHSGSRLVTASADGFARVWNVKTGKTEQELLVSHKGIHNVAFGPLGKKLTAIAADDTARIWTEEAFGNPIVLHGHRNRIWKTVFNRDESRMITVSTDHTIRLWDANSGALIIELSHRGLPVVNATLNAEGSRVLAVFENASVLDWQMFASHAELIEHAKSVVPRCLSAQDRVRLKLTETDDVPDWCVRFEK